MECEQYEYKDIDHGLTVKAQGPIRFLVLREEEKTRSYLDADQKDQRRPAYSMKEPYEHQRSPVVIDNNTIKKASSSTGQEF